MKRKARLLVLLLVVACAFIAGYWANHGSGGNGVAVRKVLYYVDPMNPALKSDKPGIAPCGMALEPVYADRDAAAGNSPIVMPPGTVRITPNKQQLIGVRTMTIEKTPWSHTQRVLGRVTPDETLVYRVNAAVNCTIENVLPVTTGSLVKKDELLATYYAPEYRTTLLVYYNLIKTAGTGVGAGLVGGGSQTGANVGKELRARGYENYGLTGRSDTGLQKEYYRQLLVNYGFGEKQLTEMESTLTIPEVVEVRAPISGFIIYRNVSTALHADRGADLFRIADLSRVWILVDIFENEASYFKPGMQVTMELPYQKKTFYAQVSPVLPQFDPATRTLKVRLVADNPGFALRPDMFLNVEFPLNGPPAIIVPVEAILDSGLKKTIFVDRGNGFFEPRQIETGRLLGDRVEIVQGVMPGEKIVISGNFLIDSEARMQQVASGITGKISRDPVCGMNIDEDRSRAEGNFVDYKGRTYFFCDANDREKFRKDPAQYLKSPSAGGDMPMTDASNAMVMHPSHDPAAVSKSRGAKTAADAHAAMKMTDMSAASPKTESRAGAMAMPEKSVASPKTESGAGAMAIPPAANSGMQHPQLAYPPGMVPPDAPASMAMPEKSAASPKTGSEAGAMAMPPATSSGTQHPQLPYPPGMVPPEAPAAVPVPDVKGGQMRPSAIAAPKIYRARMIPRFTPPARIKPGPEMNQVPVPFPPTQRSAPGMPQGGAPMFEPPINGEASPPSTTPGIGPRSPSFPPMTGAPGIGQITPAVPGQERVPMSQEAAPTPGGPTGKVLSPATEVP